MRSSPNIDVHIAVGGTTKKILDPNLIHRIENFRKEEAQVPNPDNLQRVRALERRTEEIENMQNTTTTAITDVVVSCEIGIQASAIAGKISDQAWNTDCPIELVARQALLLKIQPVIQEKLTSICENTSDVADKTRMLGKIQNYRDAFSNEIATTLRHGSPRLNFFKRWYQGPIGDARYITAGMHDAITFFSVAHFYTPIITPDQEQAIKNAVGQAVEDVAEKKNLTPNMAAQTHQ